MMVQDVILQTAGTSFHHYHLHMLLMGYCSVTSRGPCMSVTLEVILSCDYHHCSGFFGD
jgi:hypothetical protein